ncbi:uncharacterized protein LOC131046358 [Cryptomeria japonica]|uniref:uncharacterized protein LOC131046358 n=1 Tax=Cryptomeria japonica TaxID=3369 RepID=UPI0027D9D7C7|nr:uncharacterized protein LOC131046358 [Cryptomeria japonica]
MAVGCGVVRGFGWVTDWWESSFVGESSKLKKVNGCLPRSQDRPVLVISPESVHEDIAYWSQHVLICKFLGIRIPLSALESWIRRTWHVEGDFDLLVAANGYFMVDFSSISDRNRVFEGGPYFYNHVGLFIKPWHSGFNATEDLPTRVPVWVRLPWLPLEFWREDILLRIAALLGKPAAIAHNTLEKKVFSYARICVEIDLNNPLPDSLEIFIGSASWIQLLDYESLPFRCRFCHEYGHLQRQCPRAPKVAGVSSSPSSGPSVEKGDKGKESGVEGGPDKDGFIPVKQRNKGRGHKRAFKDSQNDQGFNRFEVLDNQAVEEGIPIELSAGASGMDVGMDTGLEKVIVVQNSSSALVQGSSEPPGASVDVQDDIVLADLAKAETKLMVDLMFQHAPRIWFSGQCQCIGSRGTSGGLALFWDPRKLWAHIRYVRSYAPFLPWILAGDFNAVLSLEEKRGGLPRLGPAADMFRTNVDSLALMDVKPSNGIFTWNNRQSGPEAIAQRLDRFLVSCSWVRGSLVICSEILDWRGSDHWPIKFSTSAFPNPKNPPFKFQLMWLRDPSLGDLVAQWWRDDAPTFGTSMYSLVKKLQYVKFHLKRWNRLSFGNFRARKREALDCLAVITRQIRDLGFSEALGHAESQALKLVEEWELREEIFWKQKARIDWLQEGDRNTAFFHYSVQAHRNKCFISSLVNSEGISIFAQHALSREARQYYSNLFTEDSVPAEADENRVLACIPSLISNEVNASLICPVTLSEVEEDLLEVVCESLHSKQMLRALNATFLVLIPKKEGADKLDLFRPIALCNVAYKIITKLMAERLKSCLPMIISEEQGGFVAGRQILDGVVVASEAIHSMATSQERSMFIKLDMAKAYDRVKWSFLQKILLAFGFSSDWVSWVLSCVTSSSFSVIMNGEPSELFGATRGLRQGDPLSPYLFIILAEGLGRLLKSQVSHGLIHGWQWGMGLPTLSHLQFVDDTSLMGLARIREADSFRKTLDIFLAASGQRVNEQKSSWQQLLDKLRRKVSHWTHRWLSSVARLTLLKSVIQALPIYRCFVQVAPMYFLKEFDALSRQFLWSGSQALFWLDSWDGHPPILSSFPHLQPLSEVFSAAGWDTVEHYKVAQHDGLVLRFHWKHPLEWPPGGFEGDRRELSQLLASRACNSLRGTDVLAWDGSDLSGKYSVVAGYKQIGRQLFGDIEVPWWKHVWHKLSWPKCNFFMWLVAQNRCLTWDNLCKRGFQSPSMCVLCQGCEESVSHIFFQCSYAREIWHFWWGVWNTTCWHVSSLVEFWERWGRAPVSTSFLQAAWAIGPSFIIWNLWLERNRRIFQDLQLMAPHLWRKILHSLGETIVAKCDMTMRVDPRDVDCCNRLHLPPPQRQLMRNRCRHPTPKVNREGRWSPPPLGVLKINSDGSSRGNPGHAGIGGVGRDSSGDVQFIFSEYKGLHTNNLMEAQAILVAMEWANQLGWRRIICESDSQVVVNLLKRQYMDNVSWQLALIVEQILTLCASLEHVTFNHIPREWNGVADCLAKWASDHMHDWNLVDRGHLSPDLSHQLDHLVDLDRAI